MRRPVLLPLLVLLALPAAAAAPPLAARAAAQPQGFNAEFLANLADVEQKLVSLAEATPAEKFTWRPAPGVRSISEVYMHIAGSNYFLPTFVGAKAPKTDDLEKTVTRKAEVIAEMKRSFEHLRTVSNVRALDKPVKMFGMQTTNRGVLLTIITHMHEHLGQQIAYARMNGVVPPWSH